VTVPSKPAYQTVTFIQWQFHLNLHTKRSPSYSDSSI